MSERFGYVIVEYNQASNQPRVASYTGFGGADIYDDLVEAEQDLTSFSFTSGKYGRGEKYALAEIFLVEAGGGT